MINKQSLGIGIAILALVVSGFAVYLGTPGDSFSGGSQSWTKQSFMQGFWAGTGRQLNVTNAGVLTSSANGTFADLTLSGGDLTVTTTNTATSSIEVGCVDSYATSTATAVRLSATTTVTGGTIALWVFGSCSGL